MDYHRSTQARSWTFDKDSLLACKQRAVAATDNEVTTLSNVDTTQSIKDPNNGVQKFASGFHQRCREAQPADSSKKDNMHSYVSVGDHDLLVQFHAHQIQTLIGPAAIIPELRTSETVLSTAVIFFRRFYLSNTTILIHPRNIAVACAFLAAKVEEERVQIELLSQATIVIRGRLQNSPDMRQELPALSVYEIEEAERQLMFGLDYMFRCFHTSSALQNLIPDFLTFLCERADVPVSVRKESRHVRKSLEVARRALVFSDAPFLYTPCHTAFAITCMVSQSITEEGTMGDAIQAFLVKVFPHKTKGELLSFTRTVREIIKYLIDCPLMDLRPVPCDRVDALVAHRAKEIRRVLGIAVKFRKSCPPTDRKLKRMRYEPDFTPPESQLYARKYVKVTPMGRGVSSHTYSAVDRAAGTK